MYAVTLYILISIASKYLLFNVLNTPPLLLVYPLENVQLKILALDSWIVRNPLLINIENTYITLFF